MRVRFGDHIDLCQRVTYNNSFFIFVTNVYGKVYTVDCKNEITASKLYEEVLINGYLDVSEFDYY